MSAHRLTVGWAAAFVGVSVLAVLAVLPPLLGDAGTALHRAFAPVCHQLPDRSFHLAGGPIALCHRCSGILAGLLVGLAVLPILGCRAVEGVYGARAGRVLVLALVPTALDWALGISGVWANTPVSRTATAAVFGLAAGLILGANVLVRPSSFTPVSAHA